MNTKDNLFKALADCAAACENCADRCLDEDDIKKMVKCIRLDRDCSNSCFTTLRFLSSNSPYAKDYVRDCAKLCKACGDECEKHQMDHCQDCAKACRVCEEACNKYLQSI